jgi:acyl carrier protein
MAKDSIEQRVIYLIADELTVEDDSNVTLNASLIDDLGVDSLDAVELAMRVEEEFGLSEIPDDEAEKFRTVADIVRYVEANAKVETGG